MSALTGTARLTRLALRRDRTQLPIWILSTALLAVVSVVPIWNMKIALGSPPSLRVSVLLICAEVSKQ